LLKDNQVFLLGATIGLAVAAVVYGVFFFIVNSPYSNPIISGVTLMGIAFALGGYVIRWRGDRSREVYFMLGVGIGIVVVGFIGAGAGVEPYINP
jgi:hypothetical protein